jgi:hypothetical protein
MISGVRSLGASVLAGAIGGLVVGGLGGRLFMFVLARMNPEEHGRDTDDGFEMGQFTVSGTLNLLVVTTVIGIIGGLVYLVLRDLRFGPAWFRWISLPVGATVAVGSMLVHSDGIDFRVLDPQWLAVTLTLAVPFLFTVVVAALGDRWLGPDAVIRWPNALAWTLRAACVVVLGVFLADLVDTLRELDDNPFQFPA